MNSIILYSLFYETATRRHLPEKLSVECWSIFTTNQLLWNGYLNTNSVHMNIFYSLTGQNYLYLEADKGELGVRNLRGRFSPTPRLTASSFSLTSLPCKCASSSSTVSAGNLVLPGVTLYDWVIGKAFYVCCVNVPKIMFFIMIADTNIDKYRSICQRRVW